MMRLWAVAGSVCQQKSGGVFCVFMVRARTQDEALGKALRVTKKWFPAGEGYFGHNVLVCSDEDKNVHDPEE
jgi:hypothetical protein